MWLVYGLTSDIIPQDIGNVHVVWWGRVYVQCQHCMYTIVGTHWNVVLPSASTQCEMLMDEYHLACMFTNTTQKTHTTMTS
jgi:hypothetical protein